MTQTVSTYGNIDVCHLHVRCVMYEYMCKWIQRFTFCNIQIMEVAF